MPVRLDFQGSPHERGERFDATIANLLGFQENFSRVFYPLKDNSWALRPIQPSSATSSVVDSTLAKWDSNIMTAAYMAARRGVVTRETPS